MTTALLARRFLADYVRNPVNVLMLVLVPVVFVGVAAGSLADAAALLGGAGGGPAVQVATAGWAAGFLAGIAMYFQVSAARAADRRLVLAGLGASRLVAARLLAGLALAVVAGSASLATLAVRTGIDAPGRVVSGVLMFAVVYLAIGAAVGAAIRNPVNGTVVILFVWILDVFFGPTMGAADTDVTRVLPTHFVSLWMVDLPSRHAGSLGDLGWSLAWLVTAVTVAFAVVMSTSRVTAPRRHHTFGSFADQVRVTLAMSWRDWRRTPVMWILLAVVPVVFILLADAVTPHGATPVVLAEDGRRTTVLLDPANIHAGTMTPIAVASLAMVAGLFVVLDSRGGDRRLGLAGMRPIVLVGARLMVVIVASLLASVVSVGAAALVFQAPQWALYAAANVLVAVTYGLLGGLLGPIFGRVSGVFMAFLLPFLDLGIAQSPMLRAEPARWATYLPGYGSSRVLLDSALSDSFDEARALLVALAWLSALVVATAATARPTVSPRRRSPARRAVPETVSAG